MQYGAMMFLTDYSINVVALAKALEDRGFESVWLPEHSHIPLSRKSPWPGGGELPKQYYDVMDPFVALAAAAAVTEKLKLGTGICLVIQRDPIQTAKEVATLDQISNGRVLFGIGGGWNAEEMADHGTEFKTRFALMRERIEAMKAIWTQTRPEYHGKYVDFPPMMTWPKPVQKPYPPIIVGGGYPHAAKRAIAYGDGWMPLAGRGTDWAELVPKFRQMATAAGRDPQALALTLFGARDNPDEIKRYADAGFSRVVFALPSQDADNVLPVLDKFAQTINSAG